MRIIGIMTCFFVLLALSWSAEANVFKKKQNKYAQVQTQGSIVDKRTGTEIIWGTESEGAKTDAERYDVDISEAGARIRGQSVKVVQNELRKYPVAVAQQYIKKIYITGQTSVDGLHIGGKAQPKEGVVYISVVTGDSEGSVKLKMHHEIAHLMMVAPKDYQEILNEWHAVNASDFQYAGGAENAIRGGLGVEASKKVNAQGFVSEYSMASIEEDFAEIAARMMWGHKRTWKVMDSHERLQRKVKLVAKLYHSIDPAFTERYFRGL